MKGSKQLARDMFEADCRDGEPFVSGHDAWHALRTQGNDALVAESNACDADAFAAEYERLRQAWLLDNRFKAIIRNLDERITALEAWAKERLPRG